VEQQENHAHNIRTAGQRQKLAEEELARAQAMEKKTFAMAQMQGEAQGAKSLAAQTRHADVQDEVFNARMQVGVAKGEVAAAKANYRACEVEFDTWRTQQATHRLERNLYAKT